MRLKSDADVGFIMSAVIVSLIVRVKQDESLRKLSSELCVFLCLLCF